MANTMTGLRPVLRNLLVHRAGFAARFQTGLILAGLRLQRESMGMVPVDLGPLKASAYMRSVGSGFGTSVYVGYTAAYAMFVHEKVGMVLKGQPRRKPSKGNYWDPQPQASAKFLEIPLNDLRKELKGLLQTSMILP
jgi:hypothetical protein